MTNPEITTPPIPAVFSEVDPQELRRILAHDASKPLDTQSVSHRSALQGLFMGQNGVDDPSPSKAWIRINALTQIARIHAYASRDVPLVNLEEDMNQPEIPFQQRTPILDAHTSSQVGVLLMFVHSKWPRALSSALDLVLRTYIERGYMDLAWAGENYYQSGRGYLESALYGSNAAAVPTLIEYGARLEQVPAQLMEVELAGKWRTAEPGDYQSFLHIMFGDNPAHPVNLSIIEGQRRRQAIRMRSVIDEAIPTSVAAAAAAAPSGRARRCAL